MMWQQLPAGRTSRTCGSLSSGALDKIQAWVAEAGLELSPTKSVAVLFTKGKLADINFPGKLWVNGEEIEYSHEARYLGVQLDRKLNFRAHIDLKIKKARQRGRGKS